MEFKISSVCCAFLASMGGSCFLLPGGLGTGPLSEDCGALAFNALAWNEKKYMIDFLIITCTFFKK